jgi:hypothetical protein
MFIHSYSSRHGVRPTQFWLHYTASPNIAGWGDVLSIVHYFTTVEASSHFVIDREGNCAYIVPIEQKAWTQMAANAFGINFEIIDTGREKTYLDPAGETKLRPCSTTSRGSPGSRCARARSPAACRRGRGSSPTGWAASAPAATST